MTKTPTVCPYCGGPVYDDTKSGVYYCPTCGTNRDATGEEVF